MRKIKIAITGGIGSGKTTVLDCLKEMGYTVFSCDKIYKEIAISDAYIQTIKRIFPEVVIGEGIDKQKLSSIVFNDEIKRKQLNKIAHPLIIDALLEQMNNCTDAIVFAEVPLLFEGNFEGLFDKIIYIQREKNARIAAVCQRDGLTMLEVEQRIKAQFNPESEKGKKRLQNCNVYIFENVGTKEELKNKIKHYLALL